MQQVLEARVETLLSAVCAIASAIPREAQRVALATMIGEMVGVAPGSPTTDRVVAADLSRLLAGLGAPGLDSAGGAKMKRAVVDIGVSLTTCK